jgi:starch-binding outer membrane protein, SusD/RagB family
MMRTKSIFLSLLILTLFTGCSKDFLEHPPVDTITNELYPSTAQDAFLATNAAYANLRNWWYLGGYPLADIMSDDQLKGSEDGSNPDLQSFDNFTFSASQGYILSLYQALFESIKYTNLVIEKVPPIEMDESLKARYIAEARFLRAYSYFNLVRYFGDVPKVTEVFPPRLLDRSPVEEIYNEIIIPDLMNGAATLPEQSDYGTDDLGRASKGASKAMLARVYLHLHEYDSVEKYTMELIGSGQYSLDPDFKHLFSTAGQFGTESVFELGALPDSRSGGGNQYGNTQGVRGTPNWGWGFGNPSVDLINSFEPDDPRMDASIIFLGETVGGTLIIGNDNTTDTVYNSSEIVSIECYNQKIQMEGAEDVQTNFGFNRRLIRYADVLLMAAEALNENDKPAQALVELEKVRNRARAGNNAILPEITETDKSLLRDIIWKERRHELAFETIRYFDLMRQGRMAEVLGPLGFKEGKNEILPFPQTEIDLSEGRFKQSPQWVE